MGRPSVPDPDVSLDGIFRCPVAGCNKSWLACKPRKGYVAMMVSSTPKKFVCPGCDRVFNGKPRLYNHYTQTQDPQHRDSICVPSPKNLLSVIDLEDYEQHIREDAAAV